MQKVGTQSKDRYVNYYNLFRTNPSMPAVC